MKKIILIVLYLFSTQVKGQDTLKTLNEVNDTAIFNKVEIESYYPGGDLGWQHYLIKNLRYPREAIDNRIEGRVIIRFIVNADSTVSDINAESGPDKGDLREEAIRLIKGSGKWIPAIQNGHYVKSYKRQPFTFRIRAM